MRLESEEFGNIRINFSPCITVWVFGRVGFSLAWIRLVKYGAEAWKKSPWLQYLRAGVRIRVRVGPAVRSRGQRAVRKLVGLRRTPMLAMRRQGAFRIECQGRALSACIGSPTPGSTCGRVFSPFAWKGGARNRLRPLCFPGRSPSAWESGFRAISRIARVAALPPRCPHRLRFLADKKSKIRACANECVPLLYLLATRTWLSW